MKRIGYINGQRIKGKATNIGRIKALKRDATGAVALTPAPVTKATYTGLAATKATKTITLQLPGTAGGRNFVKGQFSVINTNTTKKCTVTASVKTLAGVQKLGSAAGVTKTAKVTTSNTMPLPIGVPGSLVVKGKVTAGKVGTVQVGALSVNDLTTMLM